MENERSRRNTPGGDRGAHPFDNEAGRGASESGTANVDQPVNTSGPSTGTEGWGSGPGEANTSGGQQGPRATTHTFRCSDIGNTGCRWEVKGRTADELMPLIESHAREHHGVRRLDEQARRKIHDVLRERAA